MRNLLLRILNKIGAIKFLNTYGIIKINRREYKIPIYGNMGMHNLFNWEPWMNIILERVIQIENHLFVDVGANIGQTLLKIKSISPDINYVGFEPNPACNLYLDLLIKKNEIEKAIVFPVGISVNNQIKELVFYSDNLADRAASIIDNFRPGNKVYGGRNVPVFKIETIKDNFDFDKLSILKIDVEGAEFEILYEFRDEIKKNRPIILIEILPVYNSEMKDRLLRQQNIEKLISDLNYIMFKIDLNKGELIGVRRIKEIGIHSDIDQCDYIFVPRSKLNKFEYYCQ